MSQYARPDLAKLVANVPPDLRAMPVWHLWREQPNPGKDKAKKIPYYTDGAPRQGVLDTKADRRRLVEFEQALEAFEPETYSGVGAALGRDEHSGVIVSGIDLDNSLRCGELSPKAREIIEAAPGAYCEISPSGTGVKLFGTGDIGREITAEVEIYSGKRYFTVTGERLEGDRLAPLAAAAERARQLIEEFHARKKRGGADIQQGSRNNRVFQEACRLRAANMAEAEARAAMLEYNARNCKPPLPDREVLQCLNSAWQYPPGISIDSDRVLDPQDFHAYMPTNQFIFVPTRELWPAASVNARVPPMPSGARVVKAAQWIARHRPVDQMIWAPGEPSLIQGRLIDKGGWVERAGAHCFNLYRPPPPVVGDATAAGHWLDHVRRVYPDDADHLLRWFAHRVQRPGEKINHAILLGGEQGIGKDTLLEPVKYAVGAWNFEEVTPKQLMGRFNPFLKCVILRVSETRDLGDVDRYAFYEHIKNYAAAPPDVLRCDEKNLREHSVLNVCGPVQTTNHRTDGIYLPPNDRRHYVAWSPRTKEDFEPGYWDQLYRWFAEGGRGHVAAYLRALDLSGFDAKAPPKKTAAFWEIVDANRAVEDAELADVLDRLKRPDAITLEQLVANAEADLVEWLKDRRNRRQIPHRMESAGYVAERNESATDGLWRISKKRQAVYVRRELSKPERLAAIKELMPENVVIPP